MIRSYKYQYHCRSDRIFLPYAHLLYTDCYLHPEEFTMVLTSCDLAQRAVFCARLYLADSGASLEL